MSSRRRLLHALHRALLNAAARVSHWLGPEWTLIGLGALVGVITGAVAVVFVTLVHLIADTVWAGHPTMGHLGAEPLPEWYPFVVVPVGMVIVSWFTRTFAPDAAGHGVPEVMESIAVKGGRMPGRTGWVKLIASSVNIGLGGSVGKEGPIVQVGSTFGSAVGRFFLVRRRRMRMLVGCGTAAGIAAVFNAPVGGAIFALELVLGSYEVKSFSPILIASVLGAVTSRRFLGDDPSFDIPDALREGLTVATLWELIAYGVLGLLLGVASVGFTRLLYVIEDGFARFKTMPMARAIVAGLAVAGFAALIPEVLGEGHGTMTRMLQGDASAFPWKLLLAMGVIKLVATATTIGGGGSGGVFAPSLFVGAALGGAFGQLVEAVAPVPVGSFGAYALAGMAGVLAGTAHAPLTGILLLFEMSDNYLLILPLMTTSVLAYVVSQRLQNDSIYTLKLTRRGIVLQDHQDTALLRALRVADAMGPPSHVIEDRATFQQIVNVLLASDRHDYPVVDGDGQLLGALSLDDVREFLRDDTLNNLITARDCVHPTRTLVPQDTLLEALEAFDDGDAYEIPVVMGNRLVGSLRRADVLRLYRKKLVERTGGEGN